MIELLTSSQLFWNHLAFTLFHFLWQGALIYLGITLLLKLVASNQPQTRYTIHLCGLLVMAMSPIVSFCLMEIPQPAHHPAEVVATSFPKSIDQTGSNKVKQNESKLSEVVIESTSLPNPDPVESQVLPENSSNATVDSKPIPTSTRQPIYWRSTILYLAPMALCFWIAGVLFFSLRLLIGWRTMFRWRDLASKETSIEKIVWRLKQTLRIKSMPFVLVCSEVTEAMAIGFLKPMVLLPASWLIDLTPQMLEAVIAHEMAHIRRHDLWVNLLQRLVEALLFYHPAIWVISNQIRVEREHCCDDMAVAMTGSRTEYVETLEYVASLKLAGSPALATAMGGRKMKLLDRVKHVLHQNEKEPRTSWGIAGIVALAIPALLWVCSFAVMPVVADDDAPKRDFGEASADEVEKDSPKEPRDREQPLRSDRERGDFGPREGRDGDRDRGPRERGPRDGDRPERPDFRRGPRGERDGEDRPPRRDDERRRGGDREGRRPDRSDDFRKGGPDELIRLIRELQNDVRELRREVAELRRGGKGRGDEHGREMDRDRRPRERDFEPGKRPRGPMGDRGPRERREGDRPEKREFKERDRVEDRPKRDRPEEEKKEEAEQ